MDEYAETEKLAKKLSIQEEKLILEEQSILKPAGCEQLEHWPHRDCGTSLKSSLIKITFFCVFQ